MRTPALPANETERLAALRSAACAYAPREERFDRITRTVRRLLQVPIALITIVEADEQWFRSVQGLEIDHTPRDISFCGHVVADGRPLVINDTWAEEDFADNPLVIGEPGIRSYIGWPLEIAPGLVAGSLCAIDTMPRTFGPHEAEGLKDLARIAESELRSQAAHNLQQTLLMRLDLMQRRHAFDAATGCWTIRGVRELLGLAVPQARADGSHLALCHIELLDLDAVALTLGDATRATVLPVAAQLLRGALPQDAALARIGQAEFCALVQAPGAATLGHLLAPVQQPELIGVLPDGRQLQTRVQARVTRLASLGAAADAGRFWAQSLARAHAGGPDPGTGIP